MEQLSDRQNQVLTLARENGRVDVEDLSKMFNVSPQTIRKDLNELCDILRGSPYYPTAVPLLVPVLRM